MFGFGPNIPFDRLTGRTVESVISYPPGINIQFTDDDLIAIFYKDEFLESNKFILKHQMKMESFLIGTEIYKIDVINDRQLNIVFGRLNESYILTFKDPENELEKFTFVIDGADYVV